MHSVQPAFLGICGVRPGVGCGGDVELKGSRTLAQMGLQPAQETDQA